MNNSNSIDMVTGQRYVPMAIRDQQQFKHIGN